MQIIKKDAVLCILICVDGVLLIVELRKSC